MSSSGSFSSHGGSSSSYSMFPIVEKTYRVRVTEDIERDLRFLGQSRVDALTCDFDMTLVKEKNNLKIYELEEKEFFTMKATTTINAPLSDVMAMLKMDSTPKMRDVMGDVFGAMFLDGVVLYKAKDTPARMNESLSVNWMALQASKPHLPHRDYVFLRYADVFEKNAEHASVYGTTGSGLYIGASIWESIEMDGCAPLPTSQNVVRLRLRRCGFVVEEINHEDTVKVSLYLSEAHPGRAAVSTLTKAWMSKMVACVAEVGNVLVAKALASQNILSKQQIVKDGVCCYLCVKSFTLLRRKHHCRVCGDVVCSKCSEMKSLRQGGMNKEIRVCEQCKNSSSASVRSSDSDSVSRTQRSVGSTSAASGPAVSHSSNGPHKSSSGLPLHTKASISGYSMTSSDASSYEDELYGNASVGGSVSQPVIHENSTSAEPALVRHKSRGPADMIVLNNENDMIYLNNSNKTIRTRTTAPPKSTSSAAEPTSEFAMYTRPQQPTTTTPAGVSEEEYAAMELAKTIDENTSFSYALSYSSRQEWPKAPVPANEAERLQCVRSLHLVDPGFHFQEMCEYAAAELGCQIASICFVGEKSGFLMARVGVEKQELPRNILFDAHTIMSTEPTIILDASEDIRFLNNPLFTEGKVRFYAGFPLVTSDGFVVGSFSVADPFARECLTGDKFFFLKNLADVAIRGVEQNTRQQLAVGGQVPIPPQQATSVYVPPPPAKDMNYVDAHMTMQELLRTAYTTQHQINMHQNLNPLSQRP